jgi:hypothetical protein
MGLTHLNLCLRVFACLSVALLYHAPSHFLGLLLYPLWAPCGIFWT